MSTRATRSSDSKTAIVKPEGEFPATSRCGRVSSSKRLRSRRYGNQPSDAICGRDNREHPSTSRCDSINSGVIHDNSSTAANMMSQPTSTFSVGAETQQTAKSARIRPRLAAKQVKVNVSYNDSAEGSPPPRQLPTSSSVREETSIEQQQQQHQPDGSSLHTRKRLRKLPERNSSSLLRSVSLRSKQDEERSIVRRGIQVLDVSLIAMEGVRVGISPAKASPVGQANAVTRTANHPGDNSSCVECKSTGVASTVAMTPQLGNSEVSEKARRANIRRGESKSTLQSTKKDIRKSLLDAEKRSGQLPDAMLSSLTNSHSSQQGASNPVPKVATLLEPDKPADVKSGSDEGAAMVGTSKQNSSVVNCRLGVQWIEEPVSKATIVSVPGPAAETRVQANRTASEATIIAFASSDSVAITLDERKISLKSKSVSCGSAPPDEGGSSTPSSPLEGHVPSNVIKNNALEVTLKSVANPTMVSEGAQQPASTSNTKSNGATASMKANDVSQVGQYAANEASESGNARKATPVLSLKSQSKTQSVLNPASTPSHEAVRSNGNPLRTETASKGECDIQQISVTQSSVTNGSADVLESPGVESSLSVGIRKLPEVSFNDDSESAVTKASVTVQLSVANNEMQYPAVNETLQSNGHSAINASRDNASVPTATDMPPDVPTDASATNQVAHLRATRSRLHTASVPRTGSKDPNTNSTDSAATVQCDCTIIEKCNADISLPSTSKREETIKPTSDTSGLGKRQVKAVSSIDNFDKLNGLVSMSFEGLEVAEFGSNDSKSPTRLTSGRNIGKAGTLSQCEGQPAGMVSLEDSECSVASGLQKIEKLASLAPAQNSIMSPSTNAVIAAPGSSPKSAFRSPSSASSPTGMSSGLNTDQPKIDPISDTKPFGSSDVRHQVSRAKKSLTIETDSALGEHDRENRTMETTLCGKRKFSSIETIEQNTMSTSSTTIGPLVKTAQELMAVTRMASASKPFSQAPKPTAMPLEATNLAACDTTVIEVVEELTPSTATTFSSRSRAKLHPFNNKQNGSEQTRRQRLSIIDWTSSETHEQKATEGVVKPEHAELHDKPRDRPDSDNHHLHHIAEKRTTILAIAEEPTNSCSPTLSPRLTVYDASYPTRLQIAEERSSKASDSVDAQDGRNRKDEDVAPTRTDEPECEQQAQLNRENNGLAKQDETKESTALAETESSAYSIVTGDPRKPREEEAATKPSERTGTKQQVQDQREKSGAATVRESITESTELATNLGGTPDSPKQEKPKDDSSRPVSEAHASVGILEVSSAVRATVSVHKLSVALRHPRSPESPRAPTVIKDKFTEGDGSHCIPSLPQEKSPRTQSDLWMLPIAEESMLLHSQQCSNQHGVPHIIRQQLGENADDSPRIELKLAQSCYRSSSSTENDEDDFELMSIDSAQQVQQLFMPDFNSGCSAPAVRAAGRSTETFPIPRLSPGPFRASESFSPSHMLGDVESLFSRDLNVPQFGGSMQNKQRTLKKTVLPDFTSKAMVAAVLPQTLEDHRIQAEAHEESNLSKQEKVVDPCCTCHGCSLPRCGYCPECKLDENKTRCVFRVCEHPSSSVFGITSSEARDEATSGPNQSANGMGLGVLAEKNHAIETDKVVDPDGIVKIRFEKPPTRIELSVESNDAPSELAMPTPLDEGTYHDVATTKVDVCCGTCSGCMTHYCEKCNLCRMKKGCVFRQCTSRSYSPAAEVMYERERTRVQDMKPEGIEANFAGNQTNSVASNCGRKRKKADAESSTNVMVARAKSARCEACPGCKVDACGTCSLCEKRARQGEQLASDESCLFRCCATLPETTRTLCHKRALSLVARSYGGQRTNLQGLVDKVFGKAYSKVPLAGLYLLDTDDDSSSTIYLKESDDDTLVDLRTTPQKKASERSDGLDASTNARENATLKASNLEGMLPERTATETRTMPNADAASAFGHATRKGPRRCGECTGCLAPCCGSCSLCQNRRRNGKPASLDDACHLRPCKLLSEGSKRLYRGYARRVVEKAMGDEKQQLGTQVALVFEYGSTKTHRKHSAQEMHTQAIEVRQESHEEQSNSALALKLCDESMSTNESCGSCHQGQANAWENQNGQAQTKAKGRRPRRCGTCPGCCSPCCGACEACKKRAKLGRTDSFYANCDLRPCNLLSKTTFGAYRVRALRWIQSLPGAQKEKLQQQFEFVFVSLDSNKSKVDRKAIDGPKVGSDAGVSTADGKPTDQPKRGSDAGIAMTGGNSMDMLKSGDAGMTDSPHSGHSGSPRFVKESCAMVGDNQNLPVVGLEAGIPGKRCGNCAGCRAARCGVCNYCAGQPERGAELDCCFRSCKCSLPHVREPCRRLALCVIEQSESSDRERLKAKFRDIFDTYPTDVDKSSKRESNDLAAALGDQMTRKGQAASRVARNDKKVGDSIVNNGRSATSDQVILDERPTLVLGARVYCRWAEDSWYWGYIVKSYKNRTGKALFTVQFDDGDKRSSVPEVDLVTEEEYQNIEAATNAESEEASVVFQAEQARSREEEGSKDKLSGFPEWWESRCAQCFNCCKPPCQLCAFCIGSSRVKDQGFPCYQKMCFEVDHSLKLEVANGFPKGWKFCFENFQSGASETRGLVLVAPNGRRFKDAEQAVSKNRLKLDDVDISSFYGQIGLIEPRDPRSSEGMYKRGCVLYRIGAKCFVRCHGDKWSWGRIEHVQASSANGWPIVSVKIDDGHTLDCVPYYDCYVDGGQSRPLSPIEAISGACAVVTDKEDSNAAIAVNVEGPATPQGLTLEQLHARRCRKCSMCRKKDCGKCISCMTNRERTSIRKQCCILKLCREIPEGDKAQEMGRELSGWRFCVADPVDLPPWLQLPRFPSLAGFYVLSKNGNRRFSKVEGALRVAKFDENRANAIAMQFYEQTFGPEALLERVPHILVGQGYRQQWIDGEGKPVVLYGTLSRCEVRGMSSLHFKVTYRSSSDAAIASERTFDVSERSAWGGFISCRDNVPSMVSDITDSPPFHFSWKSPDSWRQETSTSRNGNAEMSSPRIFVKVQGFELVLEAKPSKIPNCGLGLFVTCRPLLEYIEKQRFFVLKAGNLLDLGLYAPLRPQDRKTEHIILIKNFLHDWKCESWSFEMASHENGGIVFDITDDNTGELHDEARRNVLVYANETDGEELPSLLAQHDPDGSVHYLMGHSQESQGDFMLPTDGTEVELKVDYGVEYEKVRVRKGYARVDGTAKAMIERNLVHEDAEAITDFLQFTAREVREAVEFLGTLRFDISYGSTTNTIERALMVLLCLRGRYLIIEKEFEGVDLESIDEFCDNGFTEMADHDTKDKAKILILSLCGRLSDDHLRKALLEQKLYRDVLFDVLGGSDKRVFESMTGPQLRNCIVSFCY